MQQAQDMALRMNQPAVQRGLHWVSHSQSPSLRKCAQARCLSHWVTEPSSAGRFSRVGGSSLADLASLCSLLRRKENGSRRHQQPCDGWALFAAEERTGNTSEKVLGPDYSAVSIADWEQGVNEGEEEYREEERGKENSATKAAFTAIGAAWSFKAEDFEWGDRRDPITGFRWFGAAVSTSYSRIWALRKQHDLWFAADEASHPRPVWSFAEGDEMEVVAAETGKGDGGKAGSNAGDAWVLDSSFLVALLDSDDEYSSLCLYAVNLMGSARKVLPLQCITEATQLIRSKRRCGIRSAQLELFMYRCIERGIFEVGCPESSQELSRFVHFQQEFRHTSIGQAGASVLALSEQLSTRNVATLDRHSLQAIAARYSVHFNFLPL